MNKTTIIILCVFIVLGTLSFPYFNKKGISLSRSIKEISTDGENTVIKLTAKVYRGIWFSPDGPLIVKDYHETLLLSGKGEEATMNNQSGFKYINGKNLECVGTKHYDIGYVFLSKDKNKIFVDLAKQWDSSVSKAHVNGVYTK